MDEQKIREIIRDELSKGKFIISRPSQILDGNDIVLGQTLGTRIGTSSTQKLGFYGATPVVRQGSIADPTGGVTQDAEARTAINSILDVLDNLGFTA